MVSVFCASCDEKKNYVDEYADFDNKGYGSIEDQKKFDQALDVAGIKYIYRNEPNFEGIVFWHKSDTPEVKEISKELFGAPPGKYSIGRFDLEELQKIEAALKNQGIEAAITNHHGDTFVYWPQNQDQKAAQLILSKFGIDVLKIREIVNEY